MSERAKRIKTHFGANFLHYLLRIFWRVKLTGLERLPADGPFILCFNHESNLDGLLIISSMSRKYGKKVYGLAKRELFSIPVIGKLISSYAISTDRQGDASSALSIAENVLKNGKILMLCPEGTRTRDGKIQQFRVGAALLALKTGAPLVPARICGTYQIYPRHKRLPRIFNKGLRRYQIEMIFGSPINPEPGIDKFTLTRRLQQCVEGLKE